MSLNYKTFFLFGWEAPPNMVFPPLYDGFMGVASDTSFICIPLDNFQQSFLSASFALRESFNDLLCLCFLHWLLLSILGSLSMGSFFDSFT